MKSKNAFSYRKKRHDILDIIPHLSDTYHICRTWHLDGSSLTFTGCRASKGLFPQPLLIRTITLYYVSVLCQGIASCTDPKITVYLVYAEDFDKTGA